MAVKREKRSFVFNNRKLINLPNLKDLCVYRQYYLTIFGGDKNFKAFFIFSYNIVYVQSTASKQSTNQTIHFGVYTALNSWGISANIKLQMYSVTSC
jgi:hypothetical protein